MGLQSLSQSLFSIRLFWYYQNNLSPLLRITSIDVGQGESTLIQFPKGSTMLIDGGGFYDNSFDVGELVVAPVIWKKKIKTIDYLVLSHPHPDHLNGLVSIARMLKVNEVWTNGEKLDTEPFQEFEKIIREKKIKHIIIDSKHPDRIVNGVQIEFLHPPKTDWHDRSTMDHSEINNHSLVIKLTYKDILMLFTGDIYQEVERELIDAGNDLKSTILKVPHHGSATSSSLPFLEKVQPQIALFNAGFSNIFNHILCFTFNTNICFWYILKRFFWVKITMRTTNNYWYRGIIIFDKICSFYYIL